MDRARLASRQVYREYKLVRHAVAIQIVGLRWQNGHLGSGHDSNGKRPGEPQRRTRRFSYRNDGQSRYRRGGGVGYFYLQPLRKIG